MAAKKKSKFENKFKSTAASESRTANVRDERKVKDEQPKLSFNFKDFDFNQCPPGQTLEKWQEERMLDKLVRRFVEVCSFTRQEAVQQGLLKVYGDFPENSHFKIPVSVQKCHNAPICGLFAKPANFIFKFLSLKISLIQADCHRKQVLIVRSTRFHCFE